MFISELECLHQPEGLINGPADGEIIDRDLAEVTLDVDDEQTSERDAVFLYVDSIAARDVSTLVCEERDVHTSESALFTRCVDPGQVREVTVCGASYHLTTDAAELSTENKGMIME